MSSCGRCGFPRVCVCVCVHCACSVNAHRRARTHARQLRNWAHAWPDDVRPTTIESCTAACASITAADKCTGLCRWEAYSDYAEGGGACKPADCTLLGTAKACKATFHVQGP